MQNHVPRQRQNVSGTREAHNGTTRRAFDPLEPPQRSQPRRPTSGLAYALFMFSSQWFLVPQGMGIIAVILHQLPYQFRGLEIISKIVWVYTIVLLGSCLGLYVLRILLYPRHVAYQLRHSILETSCLASISIAFTSIIQMVALTVVREWGSAWGIVAFVLWWINTALAVLAVLGIPYIYVQVQPPGIKGVPPATLLPLIAALTSAAGAGVICRYGAISARLQVPMIIVSYLEIGIGLPLAVCLETIYLARLFDRAFPATKEIYQTMILCGPFGQASFALQMLGQVVQRGSFASYDRGTFLTANSAPTVGVTSQFAGLLSWGFGTFWWALSIISIVHSLLAQSGGLRATSFTLGAWSLVFPWGVYTNAAIMLGKIMKSPAFDVWSTALTILLLFMAINNHIWTVKGLMSGTIFSLQKG
ncbi:malic acid transporter [Coccidioides immitis RS]|uniref:Sulfite efflux pump SSU1 n=1 Tax=Coccidioides immitis (strain RS) TaxID=246410 RepID=J3K622_COCIM|nr:malic acid transporter [Coccidioides immitis RS]EAS29970.3 malic acid transporter [Coccidioides immitis RS]TPX22197.1 hypothetical protein DIZ76_014062 [Coccidioides immitis]